MSGEELYNADCAAHPTYLNGKPRTPWEKLGSIFRKSWEQKAAELTPPCDFCNQPGHADDPCPVRHESAVRHAEEGAKAYPPATGVEAMVCDVVKDAARRFELPYDDLADVVCRDIAVRQRKCASQYGRTLEQNNAPLRVRLLNAYEEALDLSNYLQWSIQGSENGDPVEMFEGQRNYAVCLSLTLAGEIRRLSEAKGGQP